MLSRNNASYNKGYQKRQPLDLDELEQSFLKLEEVTRLVPNLQKLDIDWDNGIVQIVFSAQNPKGTRFWSHVRRFKVWEGKSNPNFVRVAELVAKRNCYRKFFGRKRLEKWIGSF